MTLQQIEYILELNRTRHFSNAARQCNVTQPTLSAMIQKLEEELDITIFDRTKHPIEPTAIGEKILEQAQIAYNEVYRIKEIINENTNSITGELRLGIIPTIAPYIVPKFISNFQKNFPEIKLTIQEMTTKNIVSHLQDGNIDMAILATPLEINNILEIPLYYERFMVYTSENIIMSHQNLKPNEIPQSDLWLLQEGHCLRNQVFNFCSSIGVSYKIYEAGSIDTLIKIVDTNGGLTLIPELHIASLNEEQKKRIITIDNPPATREVSIIIRADFIKEKMVNTVSDTIKTIIPSHMIDERLKKYAIRLK